MYNVEHDAVLAQTKTIDKQYPARTMQSMTRMLLNPL